MAGVAGYEEDQSMCLMEGAWQTAGQGTTLVEGSGYTVGNSTMLELLWKFLGYSVKYEVKFIYI